MFAQFTTSDKLQAVMQRQVSGDGSNDEVSVGLFVDEASKAITAMTLGNHMIVGVRQWHLRSYETDQGVRGFSSRGEPIISVETLAWEQRNSLKTNVGFWAVGKEDMMSV